MNTADSIALTLVVVSLAMPDCVASESDATHHAKSLRKLSYYLRPVKSLTLAREWEEAARKQAQETEQRARWIEARRLSDVIWEEIGNALWAESQAAQ